MYLPTGRLMMDQYIDGVVPVQVTQEEKDFLIGNLRRIHAAYDDEGCDLTAFTAKAADELCWLADMANSEGTRAVIYLRRARKAESKVAQLLLAEEGAKEAFGHLVQQKRDLEAECKRLRRLLDGAYETIRRQAVTPNSNSTTP